MSQGSRKGKDGAGRHLTRTAIVNSPELTIPIRHKNGTSYDGTAVINSHHPAETLGAVRSVRLPVREERHRAQSGQGREASEGGGQRGQDPGDHRHASAATAGRAACGHAEGQTRPGDPRRAALPRAAAGGTVRAAVLRTFFSSYFWPKCGRYHRSCKIDPVVIIQI